jgi:hypothetical protein
MTKEQLELLPPPPPMRERAAGSYSIIVREYQSVREVELLRVGNHPEAIVKALREKMLRGDKHKIHKYTSVRAVLIRGGGAA